MKILLDSCIWGGVVEPLRELGHDVVWIGHWEKDPGDQEILSFAHANERIVVTLDKDFGTLAILHERPHYGIIRLVDMSVREHASACHAIVEEFGDELLAGGIITAYADRIRLREARPLNDLENGK